MKLQYHMIHSSTAVRTMILCAINKRAQCYCAATAFIVASRSIPLSLCHAGLPPLPPRIRAASLLSIYVSGFSLIARYSCSSTGSILWKRGDWRPRQPHHRCRLDQVWSINIGKNGCSLSLHFSFKSQTSIIFFFFLWFLQYLRTAGEPPCNEHNEPS